MRRARMRSSIFFLILLVTSSFSLFPGEIPVAEGAGASWLTGWDYRQEHNVTASSGAGTDYPMEIRVYFNQSYDTILSNGEHNPTHMSNEPHAVYFNGRTYFVWQGDDGYDPYIGWYDHSTGAWSKPEWIGPNPLTDDSHGSPVLVIDDAGYIHVYFGAHSTALKHYKSDSTEDIRAWTAQANFPASAKPTYPQISKMANGTIVMSYRENDGAGSYIQKVSFSYDNCATWPTTQTIIDHAGDKYPYANDAQLNSTDSALFITWRQYDDSEATSYDVYVAYLNFADMNMYNMSGSNLGVLVDDAEAQASCEAIDTGASPGTWVGYLFMEVYDEKPHILANVIIGADYALNYTRWTGSAWTTPIIVNYTDGNADTGALVVHSDTNVTAYVTGWGTDADPGGDLSEWTYDGASFTHDQNILNQSETSEELHIVNIVQAEKTGATQYLDELFLYVTERTGLHGSDLEGYAYGYDGLIQTGDSVDTGGKCQTDFTDIRFTDDDGDTLLDIYNFTGIDSDYADFYVGVADSLDTTDQIIYIYYGETGVSSVSDIGSVALFFDDFDDSSFDTLKWTVITDGGGGVSEAGAVLTIHGAGDDNRVYLRSDVTFPRNYTLRVSAKRTDQNIEIYTMWDGVIAGAADNPDNAYRSPCYRNWDGTPDYTIDRFLNNVELQLENWATGLDANWHDYVVNIDSDGIEWSLDGVMAQRSTNHYWNATTYIGFSHRRNGDGDDCSYDDITVLYSIGDPPLNGGWGAEENAPTNTAPVLGGYTISDWDGEALYTDGEFSNWWLQATDADGGSDIATFECAFLLGSDWCNFTFTSSTGLCVRDTDGPFTIHEDGQSSSGTTKNALGILAIEDWAEPTENVVVYGKVTDASSATSGWGVLPGIGFSVREPESSGDTGGYDDPGDDEEDPVDEEPIPQCWMTNTDNLNAMSVDELRILADILGLPYTEDTTKAELVEAIYTEATRLCDEGETPFSSCLMDEEEKLAKLEYLMGLSVQELRAECDALGISYLLWRDPEPYIILIFTVGYQCSVPDEFYEGVFDPEDWDGDGTENWDDPDMFDKNRKAFEARIEDINLEESLPWIEGNGYILIILLLVFAFMYSQVKKKDKPGSRGESLIRPRQGGYLPGERKK